METLVSEASSKAVDLKERGQDAIEGEKQRVKRTARAAASAAREAWEEES
jgi:hypothetical protein